MLTFHQASIILFASVLGWCALVAVIRAISEGCVMLKRHQAFLLLSASVLGWCALVAVVNVVIDVVVLP